jgi:polysaccharide export outer membrane protein
MNRAHTLRILALSFAAVVGLPAASRAQEAPATPAMPPSDLSLKPGDILQIGIWPDNTLSGSFVVEETGLVYLPFMGAVQVLGVCGDQLRNQLREGYSTILKEPVVTITPQFRVGVMGEVRGPGIRLIDPTVDLLELIQMAGGFTSSAKSSEVRIIRSGSVVEMNVERALEQATDLSSMTLRSGDNIIVPRKSSVDINTVIGFFNFGLTTFLLIERIVDNSGSGSDSNSGSNP